MEESGSEGLDDLVLRLKDSFLKVCVYVCVWGRGGVYWHVCKWVFHVVVHHCRHRHCFYIMLFSTLEQTQCGLVACDSEGVTVAFYSAF